MIFNRPGPAFRVAISFLIVAVLLFLHYPGTKSSEEPGTTMTNFTLYGYGEGEKALSWVLSGEKGERDSDGLVAHGFELKIKEGGEVVARLSGEKLRLEGEGKDEIVIIPGEVNIKLERFEGTAREVRFNSSTGVTSGGQIEVTENRDGQRLNLTGQDFTYRHEEEILRISEGFELTGSGEGEERTEIEGKELSWQPREIIEMSGDIVASLPSGWELKAEKVNWDPDQGLLESSGSAEATKESTRIEGQAMNYDSKEEKISVSEGKIVTEEE